MMCCYSVAINQQELMRTLTSGLLLPTTSSYLVYIIRAFYYYIFVFFVAVVNYSFFISVGLMNETIWCCVVHFSVRDFSATNTAHFLHGKPPFLYKSIPHITKNIRSSSGYSKRSLLSPVKSLSPKAIYLFLP